MRRFLEGILMILSIVLLSISIYFLMGMFAQEKHDRDVYEKVIEIYENAEEQTGEDEDRESEEEKQVQINAGLLALHEENPDCIGWITIEGTVIDYPVMYHPGEKNYYLHRDFDGNYSAAGSLFISEICDPQNCDNLLIYGHHMNSGSMFAALEGYKKHDFYEKHPLISYSTLHGEETYQVIAAFSTPVYTGKDFAYYSFSKAVDARDYDNYIRTCKSLSYYETGFSAEYGDRLLTLSICEYSHKNGRMVVVAKKLEP